MGVEIERKFLVKGDAWRAGARTIAMRQGYLSTDPDRTIRVRVEGDRATLTIKGRSSGNARREYNVPMDRGDAVELLDLAVGAVIEKTRYLIETDGVLWEVDEFQGANAGLVVAEVEGESEAALATAVARAPDWLGREVSDDTRFFNAALAERPFAAWPVQERSEVSGG
ncbi:MAG: CYTH domain-containing protein [Polyangiaceae bacterium]